ncbi:MAG: DUF2520 domain-containing protein [Legionella sp.]|nr:DUF2520 domain-containing protein [Legionella sp.]
MTLSVNIIGAGRVGMTVGQLLVKKNLATIESICNRSKTSTIKAIAFIGQGHHCPNISQLAPADLIFITTGDESIAMVCSELSKNQTIKPGTVVIHCSGALTSDILRPMKELGCVLASVHPMRSFAVPEYSVQQFDNTYCAMEGDKQALKVVGPLFKAMGGIIYEIEKHKKNAYHAAAVFASNYLVALAEQALSCMQVAGIEHDLSMHVITALMKSTVTNLEATLSPRQALTGPIQRGDISTIVNHMTSLEDPEQKQLYSELGKATLKLTSHNEETKLNIIEALTFKSQ